MSQELLPSTTSSLPTEHGTLPNVFDLLYRGELPTIETKREEIMRQLLGTDYDYAKQTGLMDQFYMEPHTGRDSLLHILGGDTHVSAEGATVRSGFHHEPSARHPQTKVISRIEDRPWEPYKANVAIEGRLKQRPIIDPNTGEQKFLPEFNSMFPKEYDALAVMKAITGARDNRDQSHDKLDRGRISTFGTVKLADGKTDMKIKLVLDPKDQKIMAAIPHITRSKRRLLAEHYNERQELPIAARRKFVDL